MYENQPKADTGRKARGIIPAPQFAASGIYKMVAGFWYCFERNSQGSVSEAATPSPLACINDSDYKKLLARSPCCWLPATHDSLPLMDRSTAPPASRGGRRNSPGQNSNHKLKPQASRCCECVLLQLQRSVVGVTSRVGRCNDGSKTVSVPDSAAVI